MNPDRATGAPEASRHRGVSLFIPVYNAAHLLNDTVQACAASLAGLGEACEIVIVDDNSTDASRQRARLLQDQYRHTGIPLRCLSYTLGPTRRENLAQSLRLARHETIGFLDADRSCEASFLVKAIRLLETERWDIVVGSRYIPGSTLKRRKARRIMSFFYNATVRLVFKSRIRDHQCGLKVFDKRTVMPVIEEMGFDETLTRGWFWDAELLIRAQRKGLTIKEMPVDWTYADTSTFELKRELRCLKAILRLWRTLRSAKIPEPSC